MSVLGDSLLDMNGTTYYVIHNNCFRSLRTTIPRYQPRRDRRLGVLGLEL